MVGSKVPGDTAAAVSAVGMTNQPMFLGLSLIQALYVGGTAIIARYFGGKKYNRMGSIPQEACNDSCDGFLCDANSDIDADFHAKSYLDGGDATVINVGCGLL